MGLRSNGPADQRRESIDAQPYVLFNLDSAERVPLPLSLDRYDVMRAALVHTHVYLIRLSLGPC